ncbi:MAG: hypothetical protein ACMXYF_06075 [Candidatus Woesearchaeota archaeon]
MGAGIPFAIYGFNPDLLQKHHESFTSVLFGDVNKSFWKKFATDSKSFRLNRFEYIDSGCQSVFLAKEGKMYDLRRTVPARDRIEVRLHRDRMRIQETGTTSPVYRPHFTPINPVGATIFGYLKADFTSDYKSNSQEFVDSIVYTLTEGWDKKHKLEISGQGQLFVPIKEPAVYIGDGSSAIWYDSNSPDVEVMKRINSKYNIDLRRILDREADRALR